MISTRFVPVTCVLVALALGPTLLHSYGRPAADGRSAAAIPPMLAQFTSVPSGRNATWGQRRFGSDDWSERKYTDHAAGETITLTVVRSLDAKSVYHHPELAVADTISFPRVRVQRFAERPEIAVHVLEPGEGVNAAGMYALHYSDRFIDDPIRFQIRTAGELLISPRQPMTLFFVLNSATARGDEAENAPLRRVLFAAIDAFLRQAVPPA
jgi:hypothetical protein